MKAVKRCTKCEVSLWFEEFLETKYHEGVTEATLEDYNNSFIVFMRETDGQLTKACIHQLIDYLTERGSVKSINHYLRNLRVFVNYCIEAGYIDKLEIKLLKLQEEKVVYYSEEDCAKLLEQPSPKANFRVWRTYTMIAFLLGTGCRLSTIINIRKEDLDFKNKEVVYRHLKTKEAAIIPLSNTLVAVLKKYMSLWETDTYLFCDYSNEQMTSNSVRMSVRDYCKKREVENKGIHAFRHTFARMYILNGGDAFTLQKILCHKDISMTRRYVNIFGTDLHEKIEMYSPLDKFKKNKIQKR